MMVMSMRQLVNDDENHHNTHKHPTMMTTIDDDDNDNEIPYISNNPSVGDKDSCDDNAAGKLNVGEDNDNSPHST